MRLSRPTQCLYQLMLVTFAPYIYAHLPFVSFSLTILIIYVDLVAKIVQRSRPLASIGSHMHVGASSVSSKHEPLGTGQWVTPGNQTRRHQNLAQPVVGRGVRSGVVDFLICGLTVRTMQFLTPYHRVMAQIN